MRASYCLPSGNYNIVLSNDKKHIDNCLFFHAKEPVADIEAGDHYVQFLCINIERKTGGDTDGSKENQDGTDGHLEL